MVISDGLKAIQNFEINAEVVESCGDCRENIRMMCEFFVEMVLEVVDKFGENL